LRLRVFFAVINILAYGVAVLFLSTLLSAAVAFAIFILVYAWSIIRNLRQLEDLSDDIGEVLAYSSTRTMLKAFATDGILAALMFIVLCGFPILSSGGRFQPGDLPGSPFIFFWLVTTGLLIAARGGSELAPGIYIVRKSRYLNQQPRSNV
jgi:hypothetical protein